MRRPYLSESIASSVFLSSSMKMLQLVQSARTWLRFVKDSLKACQKNSWKLTGHLTTVKERFTQLLVLLLLVPECHSSPTISTWIQTIWKLPTILPKSSVDQAVATNTVKRLALCWKTATLLRFLSTWSIWKNSHSIVFLKLFALKPSATELESSAQKSSVWHQPRL